jgi:uncharacterized membrane protein YbhN (UPF0104 family)
LKPRIRAVRNAEPPAKSGKRPAYIDRIVLVGTILIFCAAIVVLFDQFRSIRIDGVFALFASMRRSQVFAAIGLTAASYLLLTGYDLLALHYVRHQLRFRDVVLTSFTAFAFSNNLGFQLFSGGSMRYRIYSNLGLQADEIFGIVAFCTFTYALGVITIGGTVFALESAEVVSLLKVPSWLISAAGFSMLAFIVAYLAVTAIRPERITFARLNVKLPTFALAMGQVALASVDAVLAGSVFYVLLPTEFQFGFASYLGVYMIAATTSVLSLVPGGLGVFETAMTLMTAVPSKATAIGVFLVYRMIYFVAPFLIAIICFMMHEMKRMAKKHNATSTAVSG